MSAAMDFPADPVINQKYTAPSGSVYVWDGVAWTISYFDSASQQFNTLADLLAQIRTLLQDTDLTAGDYRYSDASLVTNINQGMIEMLRMRPDIFLANGFKAPQFSVLRPGDLLTIETQFVPALVYYAVGMAQLRDDEETQDARASMFLGKFSSMTMGVA